MTFRKFFLLMISLSMIATLVGCGSSSSPAVLTVTVSPNAPTVVTANQQVPVFAAVGNDPSNAGVTWSVTCAAAPCGYFSPTTSLTNIPVTYIAPPFIAASPNANIVITATSVTNSAVSASEPAITAVNPATLADGNYVFSLTGYSTEYYTVSGVFTVASGVITGGEQDFTDVDNPDVFSQNLTGTVAATTDGNLQIVLNTGSDNVGAAGVETINGSILPLSTTGKTFITEFDPSGSASGELDAQTSASANTPAGGYAFVLGGDVIGIGGVINVDGTAVDGSGTISGTGSIFDANIEGDTFAGETFAASTVTVADALGRVTFTLNPTDSTDFDVIVLQGYIVDANHIRLVEGNSGDGDTFGGITGGVALAQTIPTGGFIAASAENTYVVGFNGGDPNGYLKAVGQITPAAAGTVSGFVDFNDLVQVEPASPDPVTAAAFSVDPTGDVTIAGLTDGTNTFNVQLYLDGNGNALAITLDPADVLVGRGVQQAAGLATTAASFANAYAFGATGADVTGEAELDAVGPIWADGVGTTTGFVDLNWFNSETGPLFTDVPVTDTFSTTAASNIFTGTITGIDVTSCALFSGNDESTCSNDVFNYYLLDATGDNIAIETDANQLTLGLYQQQ